VTGLENKEKINYLKQYRSLSMEIDQITKELQRWQDLATRISPSYSDMPHGGGSDKVQTAAVEVAELTDKLNQKLHQAIMVQENIKKLLESLDDIKLRQLMYYRYINGMRWEEIAVRMDFNYRWVLRLHRKALNQISEQAIESHIKTVIQL
jgi:DNA-directed RNA polymerase specialized sigma subunit